MTLNPQLLLQMARRRVNNPSAWPAYDQQVSDLIERLIARIEELEAERKAAPPDAELDALMARLKAEASNALDDTVIATITALRTQLAAMHKPWADRADDLTVEIDATHPFVTKDWPRYDRALVLVSNRHSKRSLIDLVAYLLRTDHPNPADHRYWEGRYRDEKADADRLAAAAEALGAMPEGYCFCSSHRVGDDSKKHEPECADLRAALAAHHQQKET